MAQDRPELDHRIKELEAQLKEQELRDKTSSRPLFAQSFLTALPIILTVGLGFLANYVQSGIQHREEIAALRMKGDQQLKQEGAQARRAFILQRGEVYGRLAQQRRESEASAAAAERRFAQEQATLRIQHSAQQAQQAREFSQSNERQRRQSESDLLLQVIRVGDLALAQANIDFLLRAGLVRDSGGRIAAAAREGTPVLPTASGELVSIPSSQTQEGRQLVSDFARDVEAANPGVASASAPLAALFDAISRERQNYRLRELALLLALIEDQTRGSFASRRTETCSAWRVQLHTGTRPPAGLSQQDCLERIYGPGSDSGRAIGNRQPGDGYRFRARGYFQFAGRASYQRLADRWGTDYVAQPDLLAEPVHAFRAALDFAEQRVLPELRNRPDFAADPAHFDYAAAVDHLTRRIVGLPGSSQRRTQRAARARAIEALLRRRLPAAD